jgi:aldose 1-epimerase
VNNYTKITDFNGTPCVEICAGGYKALVAYEIGSNVIRLRDEKNGIEIFRFKPDTPSDEIKKSAEVWGLPTLYLPNRFADGVLKTSDAVYNLPVNEKSPYNNHIHGFIHKRVHTVKEHNSDDKKAWVKTEYLYDEKDEFFSSLPIKFLAEYTFTVSENGLDYSVKFTNLSDKMMPVSVATHTTINTPFIDGGKEENIRIEVPVGNKCELNDRCLPTENILELTDWDKAYKNGTQCPVLQDISNDMYFAENMELDGKKFHGTVFTDTESGKKICYEVSDNYKFWIIWNDRGFNGYFCPEPMTAMIDAPNLSLPSDVTGYTEIAPNESYECKQHFFTK